MAIGVPDGYQVYVDAVQVFLELNPGVRVFGPDLIDLCRRLESHRVKTDQDLQIAIAVAITALVDDGKAKVTYGMVNRGRKVAEFDHLLDVPEEGVKDPLTGETLWLIEHTRMEVEAI